MSYIIMVLVQLPDGSFKDLPVARQRDKGPEVVREENYKEAHMWAQYILPDLIYPRSEEKANWETKMPWHKE